MSPTPEVSRVALVTGGAGGIGEAICRALAEMGHQVAVADLSLEPAEKLAAKIGGVGVHLDVTEADSVELAVETVTGGLGPVDILVSCAGWDELQPFLSVDDHFIAKVLEINLAGPMRVTRAVLGGMVERRWGRVVTIASDAGRVGSSHEAVYSGAKGGLIAFTKTIAREAGRAGVTANCVCPGPTDTPLLNNSLGSGEDSRKTIEAMIRSTPLRRLGRPDDIAPAVAYLVSERAGFVTGQTLSVSGGLTMA